MDISIYFGTFAAILSSITAFISVRNIIFKRKSERKLIEMLGMNENQLLLKDIESHIDKLRADPPDVEHLEKLRKELYLYVLHKMGQQDRKQLIEAILQSSNRGAADYLLKIQHETEQKKAKVLN